MMAVHAVVHLPVPSTSGQAVLTLPLLVPLSDLIGLSRQVTVLAYQYGAGLCELLTPTNGALMAMLAAAACRYEEWLRFAVPVLGALVALAAVAIAVGVAVGDLSSGLRARECPAPAFSRTLEVAPPRRGGRSPCRSRRRSGSGMPRIPNRPAVAGLASVSSLSTSTSPVCCLAKSSRVGRHHLAGSAPVGVEVHQDRHARPLDRLVEGRHPVTLSGRSSRIGRPQLPHFGPGGEPSQVDAVGLRTEDARSRRHGFIDRLPPASSGRHPALSVCKATGAVAPTA